MHSEYEILNSKMVRVPKMIAYEWKGIFTNCAMSELHAHAFGHELLERDWLGQFERHSLGWVCGKEADGRLVGIANVAWDGGLHAFLLDVAVAPELQRRGVGSELVARAIDRARAAGCEWLHVDFEGEELRHFYFDVCGFEPTAAGVLRLEDLDAGALEPEAA
jgi:GNAT superfamily N-acetyltransferase